MACYCTQMDAGWVMDPGKRHAVCCTCGKPAPMVVFRNCNECDDQFAIDPEAPGFRARFGVLPDGTVIEREFFCTNCVPQQ